MSPSKQRKILLDKYYLLTREGSGFESLAMEIFHFQYHHNKIYQKYIQLLGIDVNAITSYKDVPALPIQLFKSQDITSFEGQAETIFESSRTTGMIPSRHLVGDLDIYHHASKTIFEDYISKVRNSCLLALLPSYLERENSSLVFMIDYFISLSKYKQSGFFLNNFEQLYLQLMECKKEKIPVVLFGVSFALLDFLEDYKLDFPELTIVETGGMKGRKREMMKKDIIQILRNKSGSRKVYSEYGMTELLSQFYAEDGIHFDQCRYARVEVVQINDPFANQKKGKPGLLKITDLSNIDSCSFILTQDLAIKHSETSFEVLGRSDNSEMRGCNLLYAG